MSVVNAIPLIAAGDDGYSLSRSLRFRSSATAYLNRTPATASNRKTWTWSGWVKRGVLGSTHSIFTGYANPSAFSIRFLTDNTVEVFEYNAGFSLDLITTQVFRDPAAWYHVVLAMDTTQATASNRTKLYINGQQVTAFSTATYPTQNFDTGVNSAGIHYIGQYVGSSYFDGYMAEVNFIDGQALTPSSFGASSIYNQWLPKKYSGTYGTNGFYLPFTNNASTTTLGYDFSPQGNNWTTNNISVTAGATYDSMTDVPTLTSATAANFCVINPLDYVGSGTLSQGNLYYTSGGSGVFRSTMGMADNSSKFYFEITQQTTVNSGNPIIYGVASLVGSPSHSAPQRAALLYCDGASGHSVGIYNNGSSVTTVNVNITSIAIGDIIQFAYDTASGKVWVGKNNAWCDAAGGSTGNPSTGANPTYTFTLANQPLTPTFDHAGVGYQASLNCGQQPFVYTPPTGYLALNTFNL